MFEEPFRWTEAVNNRHSYVQSKLKKAQPVIAVPYKEGAILMGFCPQPGKIYEVYDRIAMGGMGHPADIERLRTTLLEMAHLEGFNRSVHDVTLARLLQFGLAPALKQNFEEVQRAPYLAQLALVEIDAKNQPSFYRMNYDGHWETSKTGTVIGGHAGSVEWIEKEIDSEDFSKLTLDKALLKGCRLWEDSKKQIDEDDQDDAPVDLKKAFDKWILEVGILCHNTRRKSIYRAITLEEQEMLKKACLKK